MEYGLPEGLGDNTPIEWRWGKVHELMATEMFPPETLTAPHNSSCRRHDDRAEDDFAGVSNYLVAVVIGGAAAGIALVLRFWYHSFTME